MSIKLKLPMKSMAKMSICLFSFLLLASFLFNVLTISKNAIAQPDTSKPTFSNAQVNTTLAGQDANFTINVSDDHTLNNSAGYIFSTNNTGMWENGSFVYFTGSGDWMMGWNLSTLNSTVGAVVSWRFYANDTSKNWNESGIYNTTTTTTETINITIYNSTGDKTGASIKIYNSTGELVDAGTDEVVTDLHQYHNYTFELSEDVDGDLMTIKIVNLNVTESFNISSQTVEDYTEGLPSGYNKITSVIAFNDTGLTYSYATVYIPNESFRITEILHCDDAWNFTEGDCDDGGWEILQPSDYNAKSNESHTFFNVTSFNGYGGGGSVWLEVELILPPGDTFIERYNVFNVNATVFCRGGACTDVFGTVRYNLSEPNPDLRVNTTYGDLPLFVNETSPLARKPCPTNSLDEDEYCNITWNVNATGDLDSQWELGVLFNSTDTDIYENNTDNVTLTIVPCVEEVTVQFSDIEFGTILPNTQGNPAIENSNEYFNITNSGTCTSILWIRSTDLVDITDPLNTIGFSNISFNNVTDDFSSSYRVSDSYTDGNCSFKKDVPGGTNATAYFFLDLPPSYAQNYQGNITFCVNSSVRGTLC